MAERENPQLLQVDSWMTFRTSTWVANAGMSVFSVFTAYCLHIRPVPSSLRLRRGTCGVFLSSPRDGLGNGPDPPCPASGAGRARDGRRGNCGPLARVFEHVLRVSGTYKPTDEVVGQTSRQGHRREARFDRHHQNPVIRLQTRHRGNRDSTTMTCLRWSETS